MEPAHHLGFYLPLGALSSVYDIGAYPFGSIERVSEWKVALESFLADLGKWVFASVPFEFAIIGFEAIPSLQLLQAIREGNVPKDRNEGILWNDTGTLRWYPATRP